MRKTTHQRRTGWYSAFSSTGWDQQNWSYKLMAKCMSRGCTLPTSPGSKTASSSTTRGSITRPKGPLPRVNHLKACSPPRGDEAVHAVFERPNQIRHSSGPPEVWLHDSFGSLKGTGLFRSKAFRGRFLLHYVFLIIQSSTLSICKMDEWALIWCRIKVSLCSQPILKNLYYTGKFTRKVREMQS